MGTPVNGRTNETGNPYTIEDYAVHADTTLTETHRMRTSFKRETHPVYSINHLWCDTLTLLMQRWSHK